MLWYLEHGEHEDTIREQMRVNKMPAPKWIEEKPELLPGLEFYWKAFWELSTCRQVTTAEGPIPWDAMYFWAEKHDINDEEFDRFVTVLKNVDNDYLKYRQKKTGLGKPIKPKSEAPKRQPMREKKAIRSG